MDAPIPLVEKTPLWCVTRARQDGLNTMLEAIPASAAVLDAAGVILQTNGTWEAFGMRINGEAVGAGANYIQVCESAQGGDAQPAKDFAAGIRSVINGERPKFSMTLPCHAPNRRRWFTSYVTPLAGDGQARVLVTHVENNDYRHIPRNPLLLKKVKQLEVALRASENRYRSLFVKNLDAIFSMNSEGRFLTVNPAAEVLSGYSSKELQALKFTDLCVPEHLEKTTACFLANLIEPQPGIEMAIFHKDGRRVELFVSNIQTKGEGEAAALFGVARDITLQKREESKRSLTIKLLDLVNSSNSTRFLVHAATAFFRQHSGCDAVGIRLRDGDDYPYFESLGFSPEFIELENSLVARDSGGGIRRDSKGSPILECLCGGVLRNEYQFTECLTAHGSLWTADLPDFLKMLSEARVSQLRGRCFTHGYQSMALIPLGRKEHRIGLLQLNSTKKGYFTPESISFWEQLAEKLSVAIAKFQAEEALQRAHDELEARVQVRTAELQVANTALRKSEERFRQMAENIREVFWLSDVAMNRIHYASPAYEEIWGRSRQELAENPLAWLEAVHPDDKALVVKTFSSIGESGTPAGCEYRIIHPNGSIRWISEQGSPVRDESGQVYRVTGTARDVTQRKATEQALKRANGALLMLKECDEALVRATNESDLLNRICQIILKIDGVKMAWVGFAEHDQKKTVRPIAYAGECEKYIKDLSITWADEVYGRGPTGSAIRTHQVNVCRDIANDPRLAPWQAQHLSKGYAASIALPLIRDNCCIGALTIYSTKVDAFNEQEIGLLKQLAGDLTYGIIALRTRSEREDLEKELVKISEREKQLIAQELHDGLCQHFAGTALMASLLHRRLSAQQSSEAAYAKEICDLLSTGVDEARNLSHGLHPVRAEGEGLIEALSGLAQTITKFFHVRCIFCCEGDVLIHDPTAATHLFRIAQEAANNAIKHGQASQVVITLEESSRGIMMSVRDNGIGIPRNLPASKGMGLQIMKHRAAAIGAEVSIRRFGNRGTVVSCTLATRNPSRVKAAPNAGHPPTIP